MNWRIATALVLALVLAPLFPAVQASHFQNYANNPLEHDDLGSSNEPNFRGTTSVLGVAVGERSVDLGVDGRGDPSSGISGTKVLAPGCTDDSGRRPSGLCGIETIGAFNGAGTESGAGVPPRMGLGVTGMSGTAAPGLTGSKSTVVRFLDQKTVADYNIPGTGTNFIDVNRKLDDSGLRPILASVDPSFGGEAMFYSSAHFAWYGKWADKNGNGVIDHLQADLESGSGLPLENADNEFQWYGNCKTFQGPTLEGWHCFNEEAFAPGAGVEMLGFIYPGNHHAYCGMVIAGEDPSLCSYVGTDLPGAAALCLVDASSQGLVATATARCFTSDVNQIDENEAVFEGDPLFGIQNSVAPDQTFDDRSGDPSPDTRGWYYGLGWATFYYDQSLVTTTSIITTVNCKEASDARTRDIASCAFVDVDVYPSWSPAAEELLVGTVKPAARSNFLFVRDAIGPVNRGVDGVVNNRALDATSTTGPVDDSLRNPGFAREPNAAGDVYPGASRGACSGADAGDRTFNGFCNGYAGYRAGPRGWADAQMIRSITYSRAITIDDVQGCVVCVAGPGQSTSDSPEPIAGAFPRAEGNHNRSLGPGGYYLAGASGRWHDKAQTHIEEVFDLNPLSGTFNTVVRKTYILPPDGWVGSIVNATGTFYYRGYTDEACATENGQGTYPFAFCHPYLDGAVSDPQQAGGTQHREWTGGFCDDTTNPGREIRLIPAGGVWTVPVFVILAHNTLSLPSSAQTQVVDYTGRTTPIDIGIQCNKDFGVFLSNDFVVFPAGNLGLDVTSVLTQRVPLASGATDVVVDMDVYEGWGA